MAERGEWAGREGQYCKTTLEGGGNGGMGRVGDEGGAGSNFNVEGQLVSVECITRLAREGRAKRRIGCYNILSDIHPLCYRIYL